jgi:hypothetical protein
VLFSGTDGAGTLSFSISAINRSSAIGDPPFGISDLKSFSSCSLEF